MDPDWVRRLRDDVKARGIPFFFKGWGGTKPSGRVLDGRTWDEYPPAVNASRE
jgi:protein gp37